MEQAGKRKVMDSKSLLAEIEKRKKEGLEKFEIIAPSGNVYIVRKPSPLAFIGIGSFLMVGLKTGDSKEDEVASIGKAMRSMSTGEFELMVAGILEESLVEPALPKRAIPDFVRYYAEDAFYLFNKLCKWGMGGDAEGGETIDLKPFSE